MSGSLLIRNCQRIAPVNLPALRQIARALRAELPPIAEFNLAIYVVDAPEMTRLNETFLRHKGSTDVITFAYDAGFREELETSLRGEVFVCIDEAVRQARRFRTTWQSELARYVIHGLLHLSGFSDASAGARRVMKREENRWLKEMQRRFPVNKLGAVRRSRAPHPASHD